MHVHIINADNRILLNKAAKHFQVQGANFNMTFY